MFIAQVIYAEGLAKILKAILVAKSYQHRMQPLFNEIEILEEVERNLTEMPTSVSLATVRLELAQKRQLRTQYENQDTDSLNLIQKCGIQASEYEEKFRLIAADCLRIGHGSVKPPIWQTA